MSVAALYVQKNSVYKKLGIDSWDIDRDARTYNGQYPVICHPPCRAWSRLKHFAKPRLDEKQLAIIAINQVRKYGGVLEHPKGSGLWKELGLPTGRDIDTYGGFTICVDQHWFGHRAQKSTLLYIVGIQPNDIPAFPLRFEIPTHLATGAYKKGHHRWKPGLSKLQREKTPLDFAKYLIELAKKCKVIIS